jgi:hypothetical protein
MSIESVGRLLLIQRDYFAFSNFAEPWLYGEFDRIIRGTDIPPARHAVNLRRCWVSLGNPPGNRSPHVI